MSKNGLLAAATAARLNAYSPYSNHKVGAAVLTESGQIFSGCNVENSSYGATNCAERVAIQSAVAAGHKKIVEVLVVTDRDPPWPPCGLCRQVIVEFGSENSVVSFASLSGKINTLKLKDLLPYAFTPGHLCEPGS